VDADATGAVRKLVLALLLAVLRVDVDLCLPQAGSWELERVQPELLDLLLLSEMVGEEVAIDPELVVGDIEVTAEKPYEEPEHFRVRVRHQRSVPALSAFRPVEHASGREHGVTAASEDASFLLVAAANRAVLGAQPARTG
jgi:hypothetical protein